SFTFAPRHGGNRGRRQLQIEVIDSDDSKLANSSLGGRLLAGPTQPGDDRLRPDSRTLSPTSDFGGVNSRKRQLPILPQQHLVGGGVSRGGYGRSSSYSLDRSASPAASECVTGRPRHRRHTSRQQHRRRPGAGPDFEEGGGSDVSENSDAASELSKLSVVSTQSERPRMMRGGAAAAHAAAASATASRSSAMSAAAGGDRAKNLRSRGRRPLPPRRPLAAGAVAPGSGHRFSTLFPQPGQEEQQHQQPAGHKTSIRSEEVLPMHMVAAGGPAGDVGSYGAPSVPTPWPRGSAGPAGRSRWLAGGQLHQLGPREWLEQVRTQAALTEFVDGLGPGQAGGQAGAGAPCLGEIQLSLYNRKGHLEVEVIRARGRQAPAAPYVKVYLLEGRNCVEKQKTTVTRRTLDPLYQQQLIFLEEFRGKILQVTVWGDCGRNRSQSIHGVCQILLDDLDLSNIVIGWYKLYPTSSLAHNHQRRSSNASSVDTVSVAASLPPR
uniref:C2 domain-containing protein n=1 Tax=Macrostomum lignano TaxID=282301 RepID=A0A1I8JQH9_9PLAT